jgi:hypothetical protein
MSRSAYQARLRNLGGRQRPRTYEETRRLELEIALATHRGESYRAVAKRLGLRSHAHCWRVARNYHRGLIPMLPRDEQGLLALRDSLAPGPATALPRPPQPLCRPQKPNDEPRAMTADEEIAERSREVVDWKRKHLRPRGRGWFIY